MYPNPTNAVVIIESKETIDFIEVFTISGRKVLSSGFIKHLNVAQLSSGVYLVKLTANDSHAVKKLIIQ